MSDGKISVASLEPSNHAGWLTKQGGSIKTWKKRWMVLKGTTLYYFKTQKDTDVTGTIDLEPDSFIREEAAKSKAKKHMLSVGTTKRVFMIYAETDQDQKAWIAALKKALDSLRAGGENGNVGEPVVDSVEQGGGYGGESNDGARRQLTRVKSTIDFLRQPQSKVLEFWQIWMESVPPAHELEAGKWIKFSVAASADLKKITWRTSGPQNIFIQKMVDFFWNVGAPESEIDRLNDVGALINPVHIGSWIDMSAQNGMDGGWFFPVPMDMAKAIESADGGVATTELAKWATEHAVTQCLSVGRDMGAAPPRQTEFRLALPGATVEQQVGVALSAFAQFEFPPLPAGMLAVLQAGQTPGLLLSVVTSADGFVRLGILQPQPSQADISALCAATQADEPALVAFQNKAFANTQPEYVEYQYLQEGFGYAVYTEGFSVIFHHQLMTEKV